MATTQARKQSRPIQRDAIENDDALYTTRLPTSVRRYRTVPPSVDAQDRAITQNMLVQRRRSNMSATTPHTSGITSKAVTTAARNAQKLNRHSLLWPVIGGMVFTIVLIMIIAALGSWWQNFQNDLHYGYPRTYQFDAVVGHDDSANHPTHFILINLHGHIEVIEIPGGNAAFTRIYTGPVLYGDGQDLIPVTGEVRDVNGDGKPALILHIQDQRIVLINDGKMFHTQ
jgi:hypothetical protein